MIPDLIGEPSDAGVVQRTIRRAQDLEQTFMLHGDRHDKIKLPWMPFQPADFVAILFEAVAEANGDQFLDIGCGPGTKLMLANLLFGLDAYGIDIDEQMIQQARSQDQHAYVFDALEFEDYGNYDILWIYRPFRDPWHQNELEQRVFEQMKPGAILAGGAWENHPPESWLTVIDDWEIRRGAWMKL